MIWSGNEPATFRLVAQCLNQPRHPVVAAEYRLQTVSLSSLHALQHRNQMNFYDSYPVVLHSTTYTTVWSFRNYFNCTVRPRFTNAPVHEQIFRAKNVSYDERFLGLRTRKLATAASWEYQRGSQLLVINIGSVHIPALFRFTNGLQEQIKFVNRGPTVF
jgi:hypothetical protein